MAGEGMHFTITADEKTGPVFSSVLAKAKGFASGLSSTMLAPFKAMTSLKLFALTENLRTVKDLAAGFVEMYASRERAELKLAAVVKAGQYSAGFTFKQLKQMASGLADISTNEDDAMMNAEAMMSRFGNIKGDVFKDAMLGAVNLAAVMDQDVATSAMQLGRALQNPEQGMMMLRRAGIILTETQKDQVKQFMAVGDVAGAQMVILKELETQTAGVSKALAGGAAGSMKQMRIAFGEVGASLGQVLAPFIKQSAQYLRDFARMMQGFVDENMAPLQEMFTTSLSGAAKGLGAGFSALLAPFKTMFSGTTVESMASGLITFASKIPLWFTKAFLEVERAFLKMAARLLGKMGELAGTLGRGMPGSPLARLFGIDTTGIGLELQQMSTDLLGMARDAAYGYRGMGSSIRGVDVDLRKVDATAKQLGDRTNALNIGRKLAEDAAEGAEITKVKWLGIGRLLGAVADPLKRAFREVKTDEDKAADAAKKIADGLKDATSAAKDFADKLKEAQRAARGVTDDEATRNYNLRLAGLAGQPNQVAQERAMKLTRVFELQRGAGEKGLTTDESEKLRNEARDLVDEIIKDVGEARQLGLRGEAVFGRVKIKRGEEVGEGALPAKRGDYRSPQIIADEYKFNRALVERRKLLQEGSAGDILRSMRQELSVSVARQRQQDVKDATYNLTVAETTANRQRIAMVKAELQQGWVKPITESGRLFKQAITEAGRAWLDMARNSSARWPKGYTLVTANQQDDWLRLNAGNLALLAEIGR